MMTIFIDPVNCGESSFPCQKRFQVDILYSFKYSLVRNVPVPDKNTFVCLTGSLKTFLFCERMILPTSTINSWVIFSVFYAVVQDLGNQDSTNQSGSYHLRWLISGMTHQKRVLLENCFSAKQTIRKAITRKNVKHMLLFTDKYPF